LADKGLDALKADVHLAHGLNILHGQVTHPAVAQALGKPFVDPYGAWKG
jgi:alanine dehydrogenase